MAGKNFASFQNYLQSVVFMSSAINRTPIYAVYHPIYVILSP